MQSNEEIKEIMDTPIKQKLSLKSQIVILLDLAIWGFILIRMSTAVSDRGFIDWISNILFWSLIIVSALLIIEILIMSFFLNKFKEAPLVMWGIFFFFTALDTVIVIIVLIAMGLITGNPT